MSSRAFPRSSRPFPSPASQLLHCIALISSNIITPPPVGIRAQTVHTHPVMLCSASSQLVLHLASIVSICPFNGLPPINSSMYLHTDIYNAGYYITWPSLYLPRQQDGMLGLVRTMAVLGRRMNPSFIRIQLGGKWMLMFLAEQNLKSFFR